MKKIFFLFVCLLFFFFSSFAQTNLVPNPSFEVISTCSAFGFDGEITYAIPWFSAYLTPDVCNSCAGSAPGTFGVPVNRYNCKLYPHSGNGYAGLQNYDVVGRTTEYMEVPLNKILKKNKQYFVSFYAASGNCVNPYPCYSDGIGLAFSDTLFIGVNTFGVDDTPNYTPAAENPSGNIIYDSTQWTAICGLYRARGSEKYAIVGNFKSNIKTKSLYCLGANFSYLYIDDVGVYEFDVVPDTVLLCAGERVEVGKKFLDATYRWSNGSTDSSIVVSQAGRYIVTVTIDKCSASDTVVVVDTQQDDWLPFLPNDTLLCKGEKLNIKLPTINDYRWSDGDTSNQKIISKGGYYGLEVRNRCKTWRHDFDVTSKVCECRIYVPSAFSPNSDGINDELEYYIQCDFPHRIHRFQVFDRWGVLLYATSAADGQIARWDGTFRGQPLGAGVYVWSLEYEYTRSNGEVINDVLSGDVSILK